jgi:hypothetical protein
VLALVRPETLPSAPPGNSNYSPKKSLDREVQSRMLRIAMERNIAVLKSLGLAAAFCAVASLAAAHERDTYKIGEKYYQITIGSLNEPFVVDNMSGVDLRVAEVAGPGGNASPKSAGPGAPVTELERTLKVELAAGNKKETLSFDPSDSAPGSYTAAFIPTVQTTYSYRLFGTMNGRPIDLTFTCVPGEGSETTEDASQVKLSDAILRVDKIGNFGCPMARNAAGFPEPALSSYELVQNMQTLAEAQRAASKQAATAQALGIAGLFAGLMGLLAGGAAWRRRKNS